MPRKVTLTIAPMYADEPDGDLMLVAHGKKIGGIYYWEPEGDPDDGPEGWNVLYEGQRSGLMSSEVVYDTRKAAIDAAVEAFPEFLRREGRPMVVPEPKFLSTPMGGQPKK